MDKNRAYTEIYAILYSKDHEHLTHERKMQEIRSILYLLESEAFKNGKKSGVKQLQNHCLNFDCESINIS